MSTERNLGINEWLASTHQEADALTFYLSESWRRPRRHNLQLEGAALWLTIQLDSSCEWALHQENRDKISDAIDTGPADLRYDIRSAVGFIPQLFPFASGRKRLRTIAAEASGTLGVDLVERAPDLFSEWEDWLWKREAKDHRCGDHGDSSLLAVAASRLSIGTAAVLGWES